MKTVYKDVLLALCMGLILPSAFLNAAMALIPPREEPPAVTEATTMPTESEDTIKLLHNDGTVTEENMEDYLVSALIGEMPADFELEALKAQAVAARTYTKKVISSGFKHGEGTICENPACCQARLSPAEYVSRGGIPGDLEKIRRAVSETSGQVLTYQGELIEAVYFSCSGGITEDAVAVWGADIPYLRSVESPGEENAPYDTDTVEFTPQSFQDLLGQNLEGTPDTWFGETTYTSGGGVEKMIIGGLAYTGTALRSQLGLRSTAFTVETTPEKIIIHTRGWGHRVGMSQYGADAMAAQGATYDEILSHYYPGTTLEQS